MAITPSEIRAARAFLRKRNIGTSEISPRIFAASSQELGKTFAELLAFIRRIYQGRQNESQATQEVILAAAGA